MYAIGVAFVPLCSSFWRRAVAARMCVDGACAVVTYVIVSDAVVWHAIYAVNM